MPTNTTIPTLSTGNVLTAGEWNDLTVLNSAVGLLAAGPSFTGSTPAVTAPNFQIIAGYASPTFSGGFGGITFPGGGFPNGLVAATMTAYTGAASTTAVLSLDNSTTKTGLAIYCATAGSGSAPSAYTGSGIGVHYIAIGF